MVGWLTPEEGRGRPRLEWTQALDLPLLRVRVPTGWEGRRAERRLRRAAALLRTEGVRRVLVPAGFQDWAVLEEAGLRPVDALPLCRALVAPLVLALLERRNVPPDRAAVLLRGETVDHTLLKAAFALCPRVRTLAVSAPRGGAALCRRLRQEYGAAALESLGGRAPDAAADFSPGEALPGALFLYGRSPDLAGLCLSAPGVELPGAEPLPLLSLLWEEGRIPVEQIEILPAVQEEISLTED